MKAIITVLYADNSTQDIIEPNFWNCSFKDELESKNTRYIKLGGTYVCKSQIKSITVDEINEGEETK